jgi:hypothetical protein
MEGIFTDLWMFLVLSTSIRDNIYLHLCKIVKTMNDDHICTLGVFLVARIESREEGAKSTRWFCAGALMLVKSQQSKWWTGVA